MPDTSKYISKAWAVKPLPAHHEPRKMVSWGQRGPSWAAQERVQLLDIPRPAVGLVRCTRSQLHPGHSRSAMATQFPWFPFYAADWTQGTAHMTATQRGIYISLLAYQWANGSVPACAEQCGRIAGAYAIADADWDAVASKFTKDGEVMRNQRLEECRVLNNKRSDAAKKAAEARWGSCDRNANAMRPQCERNASQSHSQSQISQPPSIPPSRKGGRRRGADSLPF